MAVVIRLQGLPDVAGSGDIRHFFSGLAIPDGGVHIIGGKSGDAFIIFATDEDARRGMSRAGGSIKGSRIQLYLSSKTEMQNTLEQSRRGSKKHPAVPSGGEINKLPVSMKKGNIQSKFEKNNSELEMHPGKYERKDSKPPKPTDDLYVFLYGLPYSTTEDELRNFFHDLNVVDILFLLRSNGLKNGNALVKFGCVKDANAALNQNNHFIGNRFISIKKTGEQEWVNAGGQVGGSHSKQFRKQRSRSRSPLNQQFYVHLKNLSYTMEKHDIKDFFGFPDLPDSQIKFLFDKYHQRTREGFVMVKSKWQYDKCLALHKSIFNGRPVLVSSITRKAMLETIESYEAQSPPNDGRPSPNHQNKSHPNTKRCIYVRNFPFDVTKAEVQKLFTGFSVHEDDVFLLFDSKGVGLGEALVKFPSEQQASLAESLNRQRFLGTEVLLRRISDEQVKEFGVYIEAPVETILANAPVYREEHSLRGQSYGVPDAMKYGHKDVRGSPERLRGQSYGVPDMKYGHKDVRGSPERLRGQSYGVPDAMKYGHKDVRGSPERFHGSNSMRFPGQEEVRRFDMGKQSNADYQRADHHRPLPVHQQGFGNRQQPAGGLVHLKNLPYKATTEEILDFFYGYNINPNSIEIIFSKNGMATGLATVYFENYDEAMAAVNELHERPIGERKISLTVSRV